jgi:uncharacterized surface protein with fasciclin (FAS1) repeats
MHQRTPPILPLTNPGRSTAVISTVSIALLLSLQACSANNSSTSATETAPIANQPAVVATATEAEPTTAIETAPELPVLTIAAIAREEPTFSTFSQALATTDLMAKLDQTGTYTVFAPADEAFADLPAGTLEELLKPENKEQLVKVLSYHIVPEQLLVADLEAGELNTLAGNSLTISTKPENGKIQINQATVIIPDVKASNGNIQIVDRVILPPS